MSNSTPTPPIDHIRLGAIQAAIWSNDTENGPRFSVTVERMYRERESNEWKYSGTFNRDDLLTLAKVADLAHTRIHEIQGKVRAKARLADEQSAPDESSSQPPAHAAGGASGANEDQAKRARAKAGTRSR